jgi:hypothetical protein
MKTWMLEDKILGDADIALNMDEWYHVGLWYAARITWLYYRPLTREMKFYEEVIDPLAYDQD